MLFLTCTLRILVGFIVAFLIQRRLIDKKLMSDSGQFVHLGNLTGT
jgi:uncharacterized protein YneF (UPF0154 family)